MDINDSTCTFSSQEWAWLRGHYDLVNQHGEHAHAMGKVQGRGFGWTATGWGRGCALLDNLPMRSIQALQQANSIISKITANINAHDNTAQPDEQTNTRNSFGIASYGGRQTWFDVQGGRGLRSISRLTTLTCWTIRATRTHQSQTPNIIEAHTEIDSHADTCCLGANFTPLYFTGKICNITPFLDTLPSATNVEICTGATAYDDANGNTLILIINEALWLGDRMQHSLLNPYQIRAHGISLCNDPTDTHCPFSIQTEEAQVNFKMHGTTCIF